VNTLEKSTISVLVRLKFWDIYCLNVMFMLIMFRRILFIWGTFAALWLGLALSLLIYPRPDKDWATAIQHADTLLPLLAIPLVFIFVLPILAIATGAIHHPRIKEGTRYQFSGTGIHSETSVSTNDFLWEAIPRVKESGSMFLIFNSRNIAFTIPKRCIENARDVVALRELFRASVKTTQLRSS
jgi:hypothetical protein